MRQTRRKQHLPERCQVTDEVLDPEKYKKNDDHPSAEFAVHDIEDVPNLEKHVQNTKNKKGNKNNQVSRHKKLSLSCHLCDSSFKLKSSFFIHMYRMHNTLAEGAKEFNCSKCDRVYVTKANLEQHTKNLHGIKMPCPNCGKFFKPASLEDHLKTVHQAPRFICDICGQSCVTNSRLRSHVAETHNKVRRFPCEVEGCNSTFFRNKSYELHMKTVHQKIRDFQCSWPSCAKQFATSYHLKRHELQHTGDKPIKCGQCDYACRQNVSLKLHMKKSHPLFCEYKEQDTTQDEPAVLINKSDSVFPPLDFIELNQLSNDRSDKLLSPDEVNCDNQKWAVNQINKDLNTENNSNIPAFPNSICTQQWPYVTSEHCTIQHSSVPNVQYIQNNWEDVQGFQPKLLQGPLEQFKMAIDASMPRPALDKQHLSDVMNPSQTEVVKPFEEHCHQPQKDMDDGNCYHSEEGVHFNVHTKDDLDEEEFQFQSSGNEHQSEHSDQDESDGYSDTGQNHPPDQNTNISNPVVKPETVFGDPYDQSPDSDTTTRDLVENEEHSSSTSQETPESQTPVKKNYPPPIPLDVSQSTVIPSNKSILCPICGTTSKTKIAHQRHVFSSHKEEADVMKNYCCFLCDNIFFMEAHLKQHVRNVHGERLPCSSCGKMLKSGSLHDHIMNVHQAPRFKCQICQQTCVTQSRLRSHIAECHEKRKRYSCPVSGCESVFSRNTNYEKHMRVIHDKIKNFSCSWPQCGKKFATAFHLKRHELLHTGEKPIRCPRCDYACRQMISLKLHTKNVHPRTVENTLELL